MESQIVGILKKGEAGIPIADLVRKHGISRATYFNWRSKYAGTSVSELKRLKELEMENAKLKRMYAELALENAAIKDVLSRTVTPAARRQAIEVLTTAHRLSVRRACRVVGLARAARYAPPVDATARDAAVIDRLQRVVETNPRWGFWKCRDRAARPAPASRSRAQVRAAQLAHQGPDHLANRGPREVDTQLQSRAAGNGRF